MSGEEPAIAPQPGDGDHAGDAAGTDAIPPGLMVSIGERGGYAVPRQLAGRIRRR